MNNCEHELKRNYLRVKKLERTQTSDCLTPFFIK